MVTSAGVITVEREVRDGIGRVTLAHPPLNILTREVLRELRSAIAALEAEADIRVIVIAAGGKHFSAGADVGEHLPPHYQDLIPEFVDTVKAVYACKVPVVVGVRGRCLGAAFELASGADIVVAGRSASFGQPEIMLGVFPPAACVILPEICPWGVAAELVLSGDSIDAAEAHRAGIVHRVVDDDEVDDAALGVAGRIARHSAAAVRCATEGLRAGRVKRNADTLQHVGAIYTDELMATRDALEGLKAFTEKRVVTWTHQ